MDGTFLFVLHFLTSYIFLFESHTVSYAVMVGYKDWTEDEWKNPACSEELNSIKSGWIQIFHNSVHRTQLQRLSPLIYLTDGKDMLVPSNFISIN